MPGCGKVRSARRPNRIHIGLPRLGVLSNEQAHLGILITGIHIHRRACCGDGAGDYAGRVIALQLEIRGRGNPACAEDYLMLRLDLPLVCNGVLSVYPDRN